MGGFIREEGAEGHALAPVHGVLGGAVEVELKQLVLAPVNLHALLVADSAESEGAVEVDLWKKRPRSRRRGDRRARERCWRGTQSRWADASARSSRADAAQRNELRSRFFFSGQRQQVHADGCVASDGGGRPCASGSRYTRSSLKSEKCARSPQKLPRFCASKYGRWAVFPLPSWRTASVPAWCRDRCSRPCTGFPRS